MNSAAAVDDPCNLPNLIDHMLDGLPIPKIVSTLLGKTGSVCMPMDGHSKRRPVQITVPPQNEDNSLCRSQVSLGTYTS